MSYFLCFRGSALVKSKGFFLFLVDFGRSGLTILELVTRGYFKNMYNNGRNDICNSN